MKRLGIVLLCICAFSLLACGSVRRNYDKDNDDTEVKESSQYVSEDSSENETETTKDPFENVQLVWGDKLETTAVNKLFQSSDVKDSGNERNSYHEWREWENGAYNARLEIVDMYNMYLTYKSDNFNLENIHMESSQGTSNSDFFEEDIDNDGKPELVLTTLQGTGTGCYDRYMYVYDEKKGEMNPVFGKGHFNDQQKEDITAVIEEWDKSGFLQACDREISQLLGGEIFKPTLVKYNNEIKVQVEYRNPLEWKKTNLSVTLFALFGIDADNNLTLENLSCEIKPK
ncbi:MAG: hypothetical protein ACI4E1_02405 [Lachnospira sp.]